MLRIEYQRWGGHFADRLWCAVDETCGEAWDYGSRNELEYRARQAGVPYKTIRKHRDGTKSVLSQWSPNA